MSLLLGFDEKKEAKKTHTQKKRCMHDRGTSACLVLLSIKTLPSECELEEEGEEEEKEGCTD